MGCQGTVEIGDNLTFSVTTHDPDTGVLTDADAAPAYRVYEDETAVAILTGTMAKLDDANTTGFYTEEIACTIANGFEDGKSYTVYITATVDADEGGICYGFRAMTSISSLLTSASITVTGPVVSGGNVETYRGDSYNVGDDRELSWTSSSWPDLTGAVIAVIVNDVDEFAGSVVAPTAPAEVRLELTAVQTTGIPAGRHIFQVIATVGGDTFTLVAATWTSIQRSSE